MRTISLSKARAELYPLEALVQDKGPVEVSGRHGGMVIMSKADWSAWQETMYLMQDTHLLRRVRRYNAIIARGGKIPGTPWNEVKRALGR